MTFYEFQRQMLGGLLAWGGLSVVLGTGAARSRDDVAGQAAWQFIGWGAVDLLLAVAGRRAASRKQRQLQAGELALAEVQQDRQRLRRLLLINCVLDVGYVAAGFALQRVNPTPRRRGAGLGILFQGTFLLVYDFLFVVLLDWQHRDSAGE